MKVLSVTPTNKCDKEKRCEYCYLKDKGEDIEFNELLSKMINLIEANSPEYVTFAYNKGYSFENFLLLLKEAKKSSIVSVTISYDIADSLNEDTMNCIDFITLSFNESNYKNFQIQKIAKNIFEKNPSIKIGINFLMNNKPSLNQIIAFFKNNHKFFDQFHFLVPKNYKIEYDLHEVILMIKTCKMMLPKKVFIDECLKTIITKENCNRHNNLLSLNADGTVTKCSFASIDDTDEIIENCPYLLYEQDS